MDPALSSQFWVVLEPVDEMSVQELLFRESSTQALSEYEPAKSHSMSTSMLKVLLVPDRLSVLCRAPYMLLEYEQPAPGV